VTRGFRHVAPAGAPVRSGDLARWLALVLTGTDAAARLRRACCERLAVSHGYLTSTGRAGMTILLRAMRRLAPADRDEVILPSYTCYSVAASIVKAGLRPRVVDVSPATLDYAPDELARANYGRVLAIVATNLYGIPSDLPAIGALARRHGVFLVDDAAQALGASVGGRHCGAWGDAGLLSLDKGKNVSAIDGGVVLTGSDAIAAAIEQELADLGRPGPGDSVAGIVKVLAYFTLLRPWLYWIPNAIPQLGLGRTVFTTEFPIEAPSRALVALGATMFEHLDELTQGRTATASALLDGLEGVGGVHRVVPPSGAKAVYLRLPILVSDTDARRRVIGALNRAGIGATGSYPESVADVPEVRRVLANPSAAVPGGRFVARHLVTLPTHAFVAPRDVVRMVSEIRAIVPDRPAAETAAAVAPFVPAGAGAGDAVRQWHP